MIRLAELYRDVCVLLIGHKKFSILRINDPLIYGNLEGDYYFEGHDNIHIFNSGEREIELLVRSEEEMESLIYTFRCWGFRVKSKWIDFPGPKKRTLKNSINSTLPDLKPSCAIIIRLYRKDFKKFQELIKELSEKSNYKTLYRSGILK